MPGDLVLGRRVDVAARPHPFGETVHAVFEAGQTIAEMVGDAATSCRVEIGGIEVPREMWGRVRPKPGTQLIITRFPQGGGGVKGILRIVAMVALTIATYGAATGWFAAAGGLFAASSTSALALAAGIGVIGALAINALIPPTMPKTNSGDSFERLNAITGTSNRANPFGPIPCVFGTMRMFPPLAARPYSELHGNDQYMRFLFDLGYGDVEVSDLKIGDNDLANYEGVEYEISTAPTLFSDDIDEQLATDVMNTDGTAATRTSAANANELAIDLVFVGGLFAIDKKGKEKLVTCDLKIEYRAVGSSGAWSNAKDAAGLSISNAAMAVSGLNFRTTSSDRKQKRIGVRWKVAAGQYDVKITRVATNWNGVTDTNSRMGDLTWGVIRTIRYSDPTATGTKKIALRIKATDQLNGTVNQFNCIVGQPIPVWDGMDWNQTDVSDNPAYLFRWLLATCPANPRRVATSRIDDAALVAWAADCAAKELRFDAVIDAGTTVQALLRLICAAGRASFTVRDGKYSIVRDLPQTTPVQHFTPKNSWGFEGSRAFVDEVHAMRCKFTNPLADYQSDEMIVYDDGYDAANATKFEAFEPVGASSADGVWRLARYHMACARLRPNTYSWNADIEHIVCQRGDLVKLSHDVITSGVAWGRIKAVTANGLGQVETITVDELLTIETGKSYGIRVRTQGGLSRMSAVTAAAGEGVQTLTLTTPRPDIAVGDLYLFGEYGQDSIDLIITKIEPAADLNAKITAVDAAPAVHDADSGTPPDWMSSITGRLWEDPPPAPDLTYIKSGDLWSGPDDSGSTLPIIRIGIGPGGSFRLPLNVGAYQSAVGL